MMDLKCEKCAGEHEVIKYCVDCNKAFCYKVKTVKLVSTSPKLFDVVNICPDCGSEKIVPIV